MYSYVFLRKYIVFLRKYIVFLRCMFARIHVFLLYFRSKNTKEYTDFLAKNTKEYISNTWRVYKIHRIVLQMCDSIHNRVSLYVKRLCRSGCAANIIGSTINYITTSHPTLFKLKVRSQLCELYFQTHTRSQRCEL